MKIKISSASAVALSLLAMGSPALAALPVVNTFTTVSSSNSPVKVATFTATDSDGSVVGYLCTDSSTKPSATNPNWSATPPQACSTSRNGSVTLYGWAKDNANGVSNGKAFTAWVPGVHTHAIGDIVGLQAALDAVPRRYANVVMVSADGNGDFLNLKEALDSISDASASNPYLVKVLPGRYDLGSEVAEVPAFVDLEGSGTGSTIISGSGSMVVFFRSSEIRALTIESMSTLPSMAVQLNGYGTGSARISDLNIRVLGSTAGLYSTGASLAMRNVTMDIDAAGGYGHGIIVDYGQVELQDVHITIVNATDGAQGIQGPSVLLRESSVSVTCNTYQSYCRGVVGNDATVLGSDIRVNFGAAITDQGNGGIRVAHSRLEGPVTIWSDRTARISFSELVGGFILVHPEAPGMRCFGVHDENLTPVSCP